MTYIVHINPKPGSDATTVEVEADSCTTHASGCLEMLGPPRDPKAYYPGNVVAAFAPGVWNYVEPKK